MRITGLLGCAALLGACASNTNGGGGGGGTYETFASNQYETFAAGSTYGLSFSVPEYATVDFDVQCRSTTACDTFDVGVFAETEWNYFTAGEQASAYGAETDVTTAGDSVQVPAGDYVFGFRCTNAIEHCQISFDLDASY